MFLFLLTSSFVSFLVIMFKAATFFVLTSLFELNMFKNCLHFVLEDLLNNICELGVCRYIIRGFECQFFHHCSNGEIGFASSALWNLGFLECLCGKCRG